MEDYTNRVGRPKGRVGSKTTEASDFKVCKGECKSRKVIRNNFYKSESIMFDGYIPICKKCLAKMADEDGIKSVQETLRAMDLPFLSKAWSAFDGEKSQFGKYIRQVHSLPQYKGLRFADSDFNEESEMEVKYGGMINDKSNKRNVNAKEILTEDGTMIELTDEIKAKFGGGFTNIQYLEMERFYQEMYMTHSIETPQLKKQLIYLCKLDLKRNEALMNDVAQDIAKYSDVFEKVLKSSGFSPIDRKSSSETSGIKSFGMIADWVEKNGYVEPKPVKERMDLVDVAILSILNYNMKNFNKEQLVDVPKEIKWLTSVANNRILKEFVSDE